jgi:hypothetical protein
MLREQTAHLPRASQRGRIDLLNFYAQPGPMTDPQDQTQLLNDLPTDLPSLVKVVQGVIVHPFWMQRYGLKRDPEREEHETNLRFVNKMLTRINELDPQLMAGPEDCVSTTDLTLLDQIAALTIDPNATFADLRALYVSDPRLHTRPEWWA